jgi:hypothetical protein
MSVDTKKEYKKKYSSLRYYFKKKKISLKEYNSMLNNLKIEYGISTKSTITIEEFKEKYL